MISPVANSCGLGLIAAATGSGEGTVWSLETTWSWAPWITLLFALFAALWVGFIYARERPGSRGYRALLAILRMAIVAVVVLMIAEITLSLRRTGLPTVVVLVDDSASMGIADRYDDAKLRDALQKRVAAVGLEELTRLNLTKAVLLAGKQDLLSSIGRDYQLKVYFVSDAAVSQAGTLDRTCAPRSARASRSAKRAAWAPVSSMFWPICAARRRRPSSSCPMESIPMATPWPTPPASRVAKAFRC